jgi:hypothetical protein
MGAAFGPNVAAHKRHFLRQSEYTLCVQSRDDRWLFASHEKVVDLDPYNPAANQDLVWKINIPSGGRTKVLALLEQYNLNAFSLFGSAESLMETLTARIFSR